MASSRRTVAIGNYDFRSSGTVANSIEIATAAAAAGLPVELWAIRARGPLLDRVPQDLPIVEIGRGHWSAGNRKLDMLLCAKNLSATLQRELPSVFLSGGNHLHLAARLAMSIGDQRKRIRFGIRASNSSMRPGSRRNADMPLGHRWKYAGADFVVAVSRDLATEISRSLPTLNVRFIPNGVDVGRVRRLASDPFDHRFFGKAKPCPVIVAMGRISRQKGFDVLIRALAHISPEVRPRLIIIGEGSKAETAKLHVLAQTCNIAEDVDFLGYLPNPFAAMSRADLFVCASRWEGASNALNEALVCGLPIVATDCPTGNREALKNGQYGTLVAPDDPLALAHGIMAELSNGDRAAMGPEVAGELNLQARLNEWVELLTYYHRQAIALQ
ncbi:glycosyltransferase [Rhizorhapis suberifaciens]|nr:glycosyltransferase [Rhizorhapis suberifaciens]